jgi:hypothetical protein
VLPPSLYFIAYPKPGGVGNNNLNKAVYCLGIAKGGPKRTVLGDTLLRGFVSVFDRENLRVGFAIPDRATCASQDEVDAALSTGGGVGRLVVGDGVSGFDDDVNSTTAAEGDGDGDGLGEEEEEEGFGTSSWGLLNMSPTTRLYLSGLASGTCLAVFVLLVLRASGYSVSSALGYYSPNNNNYYYNNNTNTDEQWRLLSRGGGGGGALGRHEQMVNNGRHGRKATDRRGGVERPRSGASASRRSPPELPELSLGPAAVSDPPTPTSTASPSSPMSFGTFPRE